jgi:PAS domain S-box-containing protein
MGTGEQSATQNAPPEPAVSHLPQADADGRFRLLLDHIDEIVYMISFTPGAGDPFSSPIQFVNSSVRRILDWGPEDFVADPNLWFSLLHPDDVPGVVSQTRMMIGSKQTTTREYRMRHRSGEYRWIEDRAVPRLDDSGRLTGFFGVARDVSERKQAETRLAETQALLAAAVAQSPSGILIADAPNVRIRIANQAAFAIRGPTDKPLTEIDVAEHAQNWQFYHLDGVTPYATAELPLSRAVLEGAASENVEAIIRREDGEVRWVSANAAPVRNRTGDVVAGIVVFHDVTDRKRAEENLQRVSERLRLATLAAGIGIWDWDIASDRVVWDDVMYRLYGLTRDQFTGKYAAWEAMLHAGDRTRLRREVQQSLRGDKEFDTEFRVVWPDGSVRALKANALVQRDRERRPVRMLGTNWDITERRAAVEGLRRSQASLETAVTTAKLASWEFSPASGRGFWSPLMYELYYRDPALGSPRGGAFLELIHPEDRPAVVAANRAAWRYSDPVTIDFRTNPDNGPLRHLTCTVRRLTDERNQPALLVGTVLDITERKRAEEQIRSSLNEKEVLLREIHHRVKNNLQIVVSLLSLQGERIKEAGARDSLLESQNRIRSMALIHESLYRSENLAQIDLAQYVERLCRYLYRSYGVDPERIRLQLELAHNRLDVDRAVTCGLLINELVSNALVHAFPNGRRGTLLVRFAADAGKLQLAVRDDGVGLERDPFAELPTSLGLTLVADLTRQLGAELAVDRAGGTEFRIAFSEI